MYFYVFGTDNMSGWQQISLACLNSLSANSELCRLLITFANSLDPDQDWQNVSPDLDQNCWHSDRVPERIVWNELILK